MKSLVCNKDYKPIRELFRGKLLERFFSYIEEQQTSFRKYLDYLTACNDLKLDMTSDKNRFPHDFKCLHDIHIDEYHTAKALAEEERKEFYAKFKLVADKYLPLQRKLHEPFIIIIATSPADLIKEGDYLHHCVGYMNYDQRMLREKSLIFFIRNAAEPNKPFVTVEYSLSTH